jgi:hypothetical protein
MVPFLDSRADRQDYSASEQICGLENVSLAEEKAYSSVQFGTDHHDHLELNSDLLFSELTLFSVRHVLMASESLM